MPGPGRRCLFTGIFANYPALLAQGSNVFSGPIKGTILFKISGRAVAAFSALSLLTLGLSVPPTTASITAVAAPDPGAAAVPFSPDDAAEARELELAARATQKARADAAAVAQLGSVEVAAVAAAPEPKKATATKKKPPVKKPVKATKAPAKKKAAAQPAGKKAATATRRHATAGKSGSPKPTQPVVASGSAAKVIAFLRAQLGEPYVWGAAGPSAWDCSGLTQGAYRQVGINLPHQSEAQARYGRVVPRSQIRAGDLLHWPGHVAVAVSATTMISASRSGVPVRESAIYGSPTVHRLIG